MGLTISILSARHGCNRARRFLFRNRALARNKHDVRSVSAAVLMPDLNLNWMAAYARLFLFRYLYSFSLRKHTAIAGRDKGWSRTRTLI
jgi:hypothetical protein